jgi:hypothetical protein
MVYRPRKDGSMKYYVCEYTLRNGEKITDKRKETTNLKAFIEEIQKMIKNNDWITVKNTIINTHDIMKVSFFEY